MPTAFKFKPGGAAKPAESAQEPSDEMNAQQKPHFSSERDDAPPQQDNKSMHAHYSDEAQQPGIPEEEPQSQRREDADYDSEEADMPAHTTYTRRTQAVHIQR